MQQSRKIRQPTDVARGADSRADEARGAEGRTDQARGAERPSDAVPPPPTSLEEAGLSEEFVSGLILKALHVRGTALGLELVDMLALPLSLLDPVIEQLQEHRLVEIHATRGPQRGEYVFKLTGAGRSRAVEEMEVCRYVGPAPVPLDDFCRWVDIQALDRPQISEGDLRRAFDGVVMPDAMLDVLGPAINSGRSLFLYGGPGNGKTLVAEHIAHVFGQRYYVPFSVLVDGSVMIVYDPVYHRFTPHDRRTEKPRRPATADAWTDAPAPTAGRQPGETHLEIVRSLPEHDRRYAEARRPVVVAGGELTLNQLDLQWDHSGRMYQAPPQLKAAGGVLVVDDLGRQRVPVRDLLNRWVVPLEHREDYLTLRSGRRIVVPFDCFVIFSTNLEPNALADEAFLRRIHYKIEVPNPRRDEFETIFRSCCEERDIAFDGGAVDYLYEQFYGRGRIEPRRCHPRDVLDHLRDQAEYRGEPATLSPHRLEQACRSYFVSSA